MFTFVPSCFFAVRPNSPFASTRCVPNRKHAKVNFRTRRAGKLFSPHCAVETSPSRAEVFKHGIDAAVEDFVKSGMNICIGGGKKDDLTKLVDSLASLTQVEGLVDVAFVSTSATTKAMLDERDMPSDLGVNFKRSIDLFIAPISAMDEDCNAVLDSDNIAGDKCAAHIAEKVVLVVHEEDVERCNSGLQSVPVQVVQFLPELATESLCSGSLFDLGVRGASLRADGDSIADLSLARNVPPHALEHELRTLPQVVATGLLPATEKTIVVVATRDLQPIDMTSSLHSMASLSEECRTAVLTGDKREQVLGTFAKDWTVVAPDGSDMLSKDFKFLNAESAQAFVRYVHYVSDRARHYPEIKHTNAQVEVTLKTDGAAGITELDALVSKELSSIYNRIRPSSQLLF